MGQHNDPEGEPLWLSLTFAIFGSLYVLTILLNLWNVVSALLH